MSSLSNKAYEAIEAKILNGDYSPGEKLGMKRLQDDLGVGFSPIREALSKMVTTGLVVSDSNKGFSVVRLTKKMVEDLSRSYALIETVAIRESIAKGDTNWEANVAAKYYVLSKIENGPMPLHWNDWLPVNSAFHRAVVEGCGSPILLEIRDMLINRLQLYFRKIFDLPDWVDVNHQEHKDLCDAVLARDADKACATITHHILSSLEDTLSKLNLPEE